jgi:hypothetical protein
MHGRRIKGAPPSRCTNVIGPSVIFAAQLFHDVMVGDSDVGGFVRVPLQIVQLIDSIFVGAGHLPSLCNGGIVSIAHGRVTAVPLHEYGTIRCRDSRVLQQARDETDAIG